jgi:hypothetical protein
MKMETLDQEQEVVMETQEVKVVPAKIEESFIQGEISKFTIEESILSKYKGYSELTIEGVDDKEGALILSKSRKEVKRKRIAIQNQKTLLTSELRSGIKKISNFADGVISKLKEIEEPLKEKEDEYNALKEAEKKRIHLEKKAVAEARVKEIESFKGSLTIEFALTMSEKDYIPFRDMIKEAYNTKLKIEAEEKKRREERELLAIKEANEKAERERLEAIEKAKKEKEERELLEAELAKIRAEREAEEAKMIQLAKDEEARKEKEKAELDQIKKEREAEEARLAEIKRKEAEEKARKEEEERKAKEKAEADKASKLRIKNLKKDKIELMAFAESLKNIEIPEVKTDHGREIVMKAKSIAAQEGILIIDILNEI